MGTTSHWPNKFWGIGVKQNQGDRTLPRHLSFLGDIHLVLCNHWQFRLRIYFRVFYTHQPDNIGSKGLGDVAKSYVLQRTLGDLVCDNTALEGTQKWVTLQPDESYNPFELCSKKRPLSMKAIAREIADELPRQSRQVFLNRGRTPTRRGKTSRNQRRGKGPLSPVCLGLGCGQV